MKNTITVKACDIYEVIGGYDNDLFEIVHSEITSSDEEDGGGHYDIVLKDKNTNKFYSFSYCNWDIDNSDYDEDTREFYSRCDLGEGWDNWDDKRTGKVTPQPTIELQEVFPKTKLVTYYE